MFEYFKQAKRFEIKALERLGPDRLPPPFNPQLRPDLAGALKKAAQEKGLAIIAEYKKASPSQGDIALEVKPAEAASAYCAGGAAAISVLTEKSKFKGRLSFIDKIWRGGAAQANLPLLRKDFVFHPLQIRATAATPAAALLLIVKLSPSAEALSSLIKDAESFGLQSVVEIVDEDDLRLARAAEARIIQVNARDFRDLSVDLSRSLALARRHLGEKDELWIAASGINNGEDLRKVRESGFSAALVGTALMRGGRPAEALARLTAALG